MLPRQGRNTVFIHTDYNPSPNNGTTTLKRRLQRAQGNSVVSNASADFAIAPMYGAFPNPLAPLAAKSRSSPVPISSSSASDSKVVKRKRPDNRKTTEEFRFQLITPASFFNGLNETSAEDQRMRREDKENEKENEKALAVDGDKSPVRRRRGRPTKADVKARRKTQYSFNVQHQQNPQQDDGPSTSSLSSCPYISVSKSAEAQDLASVSHSSNGPLQSDSPDSFLDSSPIAPVTVFSPDPFVEWSENAVPSTNNSVNPLTPRPVADRGLSCDLGICSSLPLPRTQELPVTPAFYASPVLPHEPENFDATALVDKLGADGVVERFRPPPLKLELVGNAMKRPMGMLSARTPDSAMYMKYLCLSPSPSSAFFRRRRVQPLAFGGPQDTVQASDALEPSLGIFSSLIVSGALDGTDAHNSVFSRFIEQDLFSQGECPRTIMGLSGSDSIEQTALLAESPTANVLDFSLARSDTPSYLTASRNHCLPYGSESSIPLNELFLEPVVPRGYPDATALSCVAGPTAAFDTTPMALTLNSITDVTAASTRNAMSSLDILSSGTFRAQPDVLSDGHSGHTVLSPLAGSSSGNAMSSSEWGQFSADMPRDIYGFADAVPVLPQSTSHIGLESGYHTVNTIFPQYELDFMRPSGLEQSHGFVSEIPSPEHHELEAVKTNPSSTDYCTADGSQVIRDGLDVLVPSSSIETANVGASNGLERDQAVTEFRELQLEYESPAAPIDLDHGPVVHAESPAVATYPAVAREGRNESLELFTQLLNFSARSQQLVAIISKLTDKEKTTRKLLAQTIWDFILRAPANSIHGADHRDRPRCVHARCMYSVIGFSSGAELARHIVDEHSTNKMLSCDFCYRRFGRRGTLLKHWEENHRGIIQAAQNAPKQDLADFIESGFALLPDALASSVASVCEFQTYTDQAATATVDPDWTAPTADTSSSESELDENGDVSESEIEDVLSDAEDPTWTPWGDLSSDSSDSETDEQDMPDVSDVGSELEGVVRDVLSLYSESELVQPQQRQSAAVFNGVEKEECNEDPEFRWSYGSVPHDKFADRDLRKLGMATGVLNEKLKATMRQEVATSKAMNLHLFSHPWGVVPVRDLLARSSRPAIGDLNVEDHVLLLQRGPLRRGLQSVRQTANSRAYG